MQTKEHTIITHTSLDWDAILGVWLLQRFWIDGKIKYWFVNTGNPDKDFLASADAVVDTGRVFDEDNLRFDHHHLPGNEANATCAAKQVYDFLTKQRDDLAYLKPLVDLVFAGDTGRPEAIPSRELGIHALLSGFKEQNKNDLQVLEWGFSLLATLDSRLKNMYQARIELANKVVYKSDDGFVWAIKHGSQAISQAAYDEGARGILFEGEPVETEGGTTYPVGGSRHPEWQTPHIGEIIDKIESPAFAEELSRWYRHNAGFFAGRGTAKAPVYEPVSIDIAKLANAFNKVWDR